MKKTFTPCRGASSKQRQSVQRSNDPLGPGRMTVEFLRQFARCYQPATMSANLPGYSLN